MTGARKIIITVALCGETTRAQTPHVPYTPREIADSAIEAAKAGASIAHIHVRDPEGNSTNEAEVYAEVVRLIQKKSDIVINCTTGGEVYDEKRKVLGINPEFATLNCGSANLKDKLMINTASELEEMAGEMLERKIRPELMIHSQGFIENAKRLIDQELVQPPYLFNLFFASGGMAYSPRTLSYLIESLPEGSLWTATGSGVDAFPLAVFSMINGGTARIGLEDCIYLSDGVLAESNAQMVEKLVRMANELDFEIATPGETREKLRIIG